MKYFKIAFLFTLLFVAMCVNGHAQCSPTIVANTIVISKDTTIYSNCGTSQRGFLICPGAKLTYHDTSTAGCSDYFYLESNAQLWIDSAASYAYRTVYAKSGSKADVNGEYWDLYFEANASLIDTFLCVCNVLCTGITYNYSNLPAGKGCATAGVSNIYDNMIGGEAFVDVLNNKLYLSVKSNEEFNYEIYDLTGRKILSDKATGNAIIYTHNFKAGVYLVNVKVGNVGFVEKIYFGDN